MDSAALHGVLREYGLRRARISRLAGGSINEVWRVDAAGESYVLKRYTGVALDDARLQRILDAQDASRRHGIPVPETVRTLAGQPHVLLEGTHAVLSRFVVGRPMRVGEASVDVAQAMGVLLARLQDALSVLPPGPAWELPSHDWIDSHLHELLALGAKARESDATDELACRLLERKLELLSKLPEQPPAFKPHWTHRDYTVRNLLFDEWKQIVAVIDFDELRFTNRGYEAMRCLDHSFDAWSEEGLAFFRAYATASGLTAADVRGCVALWCYVSTFSTWPMRSRYFAAEQYQPAWGEFIRVPAHPWEADPEELADCLAGLVGM